MGMTRAETDIIRTEIGTTREEMGIIRTEMGTTRAETGIIRTEMGTTRAERGTSSVRVSCVMRVTCIQACPRGLEWRSTGD